MKSEIVLSPKETLRRLNNTLKAAQNFRKWFHHFATNYPKDALNITPEYFEKPEDFLKYTDQLIENLETQILKHT